MTTVLITHSDTATYYGSEEAIPLIIVTSPLCKAVISLYGGQVLEYQATNKQPLLWLSDSAVFKTGVAIRGGIPICAPWFGNHPTHELNHGFARISVWQQQSISELTNGDIEVILTLEENELSRQYGYEQFTMSLTMLLSSELTVEFSFENHHTATKDCEWAMHSYFAVSNIKNTTITGLEQQIYLDKTDHNHPHKLNGVQVFNGEVDSAFVNSPSQQTIDDHQLAINVRGENCPSAIVWNPGQDLATKMTDIADYQKFACLERGAIKENTWQIAPSQTKSAKVLMSN